MADTYYDVGSNPQYNDKVRKLQNTDPANAETVFNPTLGAMVENEAYLKEEVEALENKKVDKVTGMGLSANNYTIAEKEKLAEFRGDDGYVKFLTGLNAEFLNDTTISYNYFTHTNTIFSEGLPDGVYHIEYRGRKTANNFGNAAQFAYPYSQNVIYMRSASGTAWSDWVEVASLELAELARNSLPKTGGEIIGDLKLEGDFKSFGNINMNKNVYPVSVEGGHWYRVAKYTKEYPANGIFLFGFSSLHATGITFSISKCWSGVNGMGINVLSKSDYYSGAISEIRAVEKFNDAYIDVFLRSDVAANSRATSYVTYVGYAMDVYDEWEKKPTVGSDYTVTEITL